MNIIIPPHKNPARHVDTQDLEEVRKQAKEMRKLCYQRHGKHIYGGYAVAHPQVSASPMAFFVTREGVAYINPKITRHTNQIVKREEGCLSYPDDGIIENVQRWNKIEVQYELDNGFGTTRTVVESLQGLAAQIFQHEIDHLNAVTIKERL